jgi:hypothetical protein
MKDRLEENDDLELVDLETASTPMMADLLLGLLKTAGIPAYVGGRYLQDEWAISQIVLGRVGVKVQVPRKHLEEAREVLAEAKREAASRASETDDEADPEGSDDQS